MRVRFENHDTEAVSAWCMEQAIRDAIDKPNTLNLVVLNKLSVSKAYSAIGEIYPKIKAHWPADTCRLQNNSQIKLMTTSRFLAEYNGLEKCALYLPEELNQFDFAINWRQSKFTDITMRVRFFRSFTPSAVLSPIVLEMEFGQFMQEMGQIVYPDVCAVMENKMYSVCAFSSEALVVAMPTLKDAPCKKKHYIGCEKHCWGVGGKLIVGNSCPLYTEYYLTALKQQGGNFSLIFGERQK